METFSNKPVVKIDEPTPHEVVLRLFVKQLNANYKDGWLYYKCRDEGLLEPYQEFRSKGIFNQLKGHKRNFLKTKLTIELVPKTCWFSNVRSNSTQNQWNQLKKMTFRKAGYLCEICGGKGPKWPVECHEIWHYDDEALIQKLEGLIALCPSCHKVKHMGFAQISGKDIEASCHLAIVNGWTYKAACQYIEEQFDIWEKRSKYDWLLDIDWLDKFGIQINVQDRPASAYQCCEETERQHYLAHRKKAIDLFRKGLCFEENGEYEKAKRVYLNAASYGNIAATFNLAILHLDKTLPYFDYDKGVSFLKKTSRYGDQSAKKLLDLNKDELTKLINHEEPKAITKDQHISENHAQASEEEIVKKSTNALKINRFLLFLRKAYQWIKKRGKRA